MRQSFTEVKKLSERKKRPSSLRAETLTSSPARLLGRTWNAQLSPSLSRHFLWIRFNSLKQQSSPDHHSTTAAAAAGRSLYETLFVWCRCDETQTACRSLLLAGRSWEGWAHVFCLCNLSDGPTWFLRWFFRQLSVGVKSVLMIYDEPEKIFQTLIPVTSS